MLTLLADYQLEWHPDHGARCRYRLASEEGWSGWLRLGRRDPALAGMLLSGQLIFYNHLTGALCTGADYAATAAGPQPEEAAVAEAEAAPEMISQPTPNSGDDTEAEADSKAPAGAAPAAAAAPVRHRPWRTARSLLVLLDQVNRQYPRRNKASDGTLGDVAHEHTTSDHNPNIADGSHWVVTALDITHDPAHGCDAHRLAAALVASRDPRVKYIIWNRQIANSAPIGGQPAWAWRPYSGQNPHSHHLHLSVKAAKAAYDATTSWQLPVLA